MEPNEDSSLTGGTYELWQIEMKANHSGWSQELLKTCSDLENADSKLFGAWESSFGPMNTGVILWRHQDLDKAELVSREFLAKKGRA